MSGGYRMFMVDHATSFGDYHMQGYKPATVPSQPKLAQPIFIQTSCSQSTSSLPLSPPALCDSPSSESLRRSGSPVTPTSLPRDVITLHFQSETEPAGYGHERTPKEPACTKLPSSSLMPGLTTDELRFSFESRVSKEYEVPAATPPAAPQSPPQLLQRYSERDRHARPPTASPPRINTSVPRLDIQEPQSAPQTVTSFAEFRQALAERQEARRQEAVQKSEPALSFLSQDPFQCPLAKKRPKSAGRHEGSEDDKETSRPLSRKSHTPSVRSTRSTKSLKRGLSRVKKIFVGSRKDGEKDTLLPA